MSDLRTPDPDPQPVEGAERPASAASAYAILLRESAEDLGVYQHLLAAGVINDDATLRVAPDRVPKGLEQFIEKFRRAIERAAPSPERQRTVIQSKEELLAIISEYGEFTRQCRVAAMLMERHFLLQPVFRISNECSDGRNSPVHHLAPEDTWKVFGQENVSQAGLLIVPGTGEIAAVDGDRGIDAFYDAHRDAVLAAFDSVWLEPIVREREKRAHFLQAEEKAGRGDGEDARLVRAKRYQIELTSHSQGTSFLDVLAERGFEGVSPGETLPVDSLLHGAPEQEAFSHDAQHGCGAHGSVMPNALLETAKHALLARRWVHERFPDIEDSFEYVRTHRFTGEETRKVLAQDIDDRALSADGSELVSLPADFAAAMEPLRISPEQREEGVRTGAYDLFSVTGTHAVLTHNPLEHEEQAVIITNNSVAWAAPELDALTQNWSGDLEHLAHVASVLVGIALKNFGAKHPEAKIFLVLDRPFRPDYRKIFAWHDDPEAMRRHFPGLAPLDEGKMEKVRMTHEALDQGRVSPLDVVQLGPEYVLFDREYVTDPTLLAMLESINSHHRDQQRLVTELIRAKIGDNPRVEIVFTSTNRRSYKPKDDLETTHF